MSSLVNRCSLVVASNSDNVLRSTLLASPEVGQRCQVIVKQGFSSAAKAYNSGMAEANHEIVVFVHQDVFLPNGWFSRLDQATTWLDEHDPNWGVLGVFGIAAGRDKGFIGHCYSTGLQQVLGAAFAHPIEALSFDEMVLVVRRGSGLLFDEQLPGFHLYATDMCLAAQTNKMRNYVIPAFCIHNSNGLKYYPADYWRAYMYMRSKWWRELPVKTCCATVTKWCRPVIAQMAIDFKKRLFGPPRVGQRCENVAELYANLVAAEPDLAVAQGQAPVWRIGHEPSQLRGTCHVG